MLGPWIKVNSVQFSSVAQSCPTLCDPMNRSTPGLPVHHQLPEFTQIHVHQVSDAIQPSHPLSSPSPPAPRYIGSGQIGDGKTEHWHFSISELKWTGTGEFNSDDHYIYSCGQESLRRNGVAIMVNKRFRNAVLGCNLKNDRMISVCFQGKPFK